MSDANIDSELLNESPQQLFINGEGQPLVFHVALTEEDRDELIQLIKQYGGEVTEDENNNNNTVIYISKYAEVHHETYDPRFILDSTFSKKLLRLEDYKNSIQESTGDVQHLVSYLNDNQNNEDSVATNGENEDNETNAVIEKTNDTEGDVATSPNPARDENPSTIENQDAQVLNALAEAVNNETSPKPRSVSIVGVTSKNGFTEAEDEVILEQVRQNPHKRSSHKLFHDIAKIIGRHTGNSIRYRYRNNLANKLSYVYKTSPEGVLITDAEGKFIKVEDLPHTLKRKFVASEDYDLAKEIRQKITNKDVTEYQRNPTDVTLPGKFFEQLAAKSPNHSKASWRDRYRKFVIPYGIDDYIDYYENEIANNRVPEEIKNFTGKHLYKSKKNLGIIENEIGSKLTEHNNQYEEHVSKKRKTPGNYSKSDPSSQGLDRANSTDSTNVFIAGSHDDLHDLENVNYYNPHTAVAVAQATSNSNNSERQVDLNELLTNELITTKFLSFQPPSTIVNKITEIVERSYDSTDAENLIQALYDEAGIEKKFGTFIITSVCGDLAMIPKYVELFLETGQNPPEETHGIWTSRDDEYLKSGEEEKINILRTLHGDKRIDLRRQFISQELI